MEQSTMTEEPKKTEIQVADGSIEFLKRRLRESGWIKDVRMLCEEQLKDIGTNNLKVDDLVSQVMPQALSLVPDGIKQELLIKLRQDN